MDQDKLIDQMVRFETGAAMPGNPFSELSPSTFEAVDKIHAFVSATIAETLTYCEEDHDGQLAAVSIAAFLQGLSIGYAYAQAS